MNQAMENLLTRRSVRGFTEQSVSASDIEEIVKAGVYAPTGMNLQTRRFTVLTKEEDIKELAQAIGKVLGRDNYNMYCPKVLIIPSNEKDSRFGREDNACALENIFLAAHSLGLGSVWINQLQGICGDPQIRTLLRKYQIPDNHIVYGIAAIGYPAENSTKPACKEQIVKYF